MLCHVCNRAAIQAQWFDVISSHFKLLHCGPFFEQESTRKHFSSRSVLQLSQMVVACYQV
jgi:hypothetical protein